MVIRFLALLGLRLHRAARLKACRGGRPTEARRTSMGAPSDGQRPLLTLMRRLLEFHFPSTQDNETSSSFSQSGVDMDPGGGRVWAMIRRILNRHGVVFPAVAVLCLLVSMGAPQPAGARRCVEQGEGCDFCPFNCRLCASLSGSAVRINMYCGPGCQYHLVRWFCNTWPLGEIWCLDCVRPA